MTRWATYKLGEVCEFLNRGIAPKTELARSTLTDAFTVSFPTSHSTQKAIVAKLDAAFASIDTAIAAAEKNAENAKQLFQSYLSDVFERGGEGWEEKKLEDIVSDDCSLSYGIVQPGDEYADGLPLVRPTDLQQRFITQYGLKKINPTLATSYKRTALKGNEILLCVRGTTGTVSVSSPELAGANVTRGIVPIRFKADIVNLEFAYFQFLSPLIQKQIKAKTYGAALMQINIKDIKKIKLKLPSRQQQDKLLFNIGFIDERLTQYKKFTQTKLDQLRKLKQSLLQQAFSGQLVDA